MMRRALMLAVVVWLSATASGPVRAQAGVATRARVAIAEVFRSSSAAWNAGNLDGFMASYERSPATIAVGGDKIDLGYNAIRASYAKTFAAARTAKMDVLTFEILEFKLLDTKYAFVIGRYPLHSLKGDGQIVSGLSSLLFHISDGRWAIAADHS